jgi:ATP-dependent RNA helicase DHX37/DHR1
MPTFKPRKRKHKVLSRVQKSAQYASYNADTNVAEILPTTQEEKAAQQQEMKKKLHAQQPKMSAKKQKRLEKYIVKGTI